MKIAELDDNNIEKTSRVVICSGYKFDTGLWRSGFCDEEAVLFGGSERGIRTDSSTEAVNLERGFGGYGAASGGT